MPITSIHWWGSHYMWEDPDNPVPPTSLPVAWWIGFWNNVPAGAPPNFLPYSYPYTLLHSFQVPATRVEVTQVGTDQFPIYYPWDVCYQYYLDLEPNEVFKQNDFNDMTTDKIYWLSIVAVYDQNQTMPPDYPWGWKTRPWSWMDDAVTFNKPLLPIPGMPVDANFVTPIKDPMLMESYDVAFELDTDPNYIKWEQPFTGIRYWPHYEDVNSMARDDEGEPNIAQLVADDWRCVKRTPITAVAWWGSYIGYGYKTCTSGPFMPMPVQPNYFLLNMWTDVPVDPCDSNSYSHPGHKIWEYKASNYDEVLVGYDKHPEGDPCEPVFRYSVRLPESAWFNQPDYNEVFWLSVVAVYSTAIPNYTWGWTNHSHAFNDDAVSGIISNPGSPDPNWVWTELKDQTDESEDMSFTLFTDPNQCSICADYDCDNIVNFVDYTDMASGWFWSGNAGGYNNADLNCDGSVNWSDILIFVQQWLGTCP